MQLVTVGAKYQIVIPKEVRKKIKGIRPGIKVGLYPADQETISIKVPEKNWVEESYGFMKDTWKGIDPVKEVEKMRDEWEERLQELEKEIKPK